MADNAQKTPFARALNRFAQQKALDQIQLTGKALPARVEAVAGSIVTVSFQIQSDYTLPQVTCPLFGPEWIRYPIQIGDQGVVFPADARLGGIDGLGSGLANLSLPANLSALVFFPVGNATWEAPEDTQKIILYGPNGVILRTKDKTSTFALDPTGIAMNKNLTVDGNTSFGGGAKKVVLDGDLVVDGAVVASSTTIRAT